MKVAHVITRLIVGGAQENTILTCEGLTRAGHDVTLIAGPETGPEGSLWERARRSCGQVVTVDSMRRAVRPIMDLRCAAELNRIFRERGFDVVHTHSSKAGILGRYAAKRAGVATVVHTIHGMSFNRTQRALTRGLYRLLECRAARWTDAVVCVADAMTDQAVAAGVADRSKFTTIRSGLDTSLYAPNAAYRKAVRAEWNMRENAVVVGTIARLFRNKGYEQLLEALPAIAARCPEVRFVWVGGGAQRKQYLTKLERLGFHNRVHLTGLVPPDEIPRILCGFDVIAHASVWEGLPRALVQAALCEVPAVSFDLDGAPEVVIDRETGFLVAAGADTTNASRVANLATRIATLASDAELRKRMGASARVRCLDMFSAEVMVSQIEALYSQLAASRSP